jgi:hypothetical protein
MMCLPKRGVSPNAVHAGQKYVYPHHQVPTRRLIRETISLPTEDTGVSGIIAVKLWYGVALSQKKKLNEAALRDFFD